MEPPVDYLRALELREAAAEITIGGRPLLVPRARLGEHYRLQAVLEDQADGPAGQAAAYVGAASGLKPEEIDAGTPAELLTAFALLLDLNRFRGTLAILWPRPERNRSGPEDYPHRGLASLVTHLAHAYGWTADHILGLGPEEAMCYLQEATVIEHEEAQFRWGLAGGTIDKDGKPTRRFPPIPWGRPPSGALEKRPPVPPRFQPVGVTAGPS
ncbi:MAG: hypothetical protein A2V88_08865 [Elusimicrobia bacterium RBG_16_66_12]|nr:MAG: hypothetical protein A2V88_08865 [Elusimicrobia bacterium RBG_16_66_12]